MSEECCHYCGDENELLYDIEQDGKTILVCYMCRWEDGLGDGERKISLSDLNGADLVWTDGEGNEHRVTLKDD